MHLARGDGSAVAVDDHPRAVVDEPAQLHLGRLDRPDRAALERVQVDREDLHERLTGAG
nr:hypothetical protein [Barrientosiimonas endolithica]